MPTHWTRIPSSPAVPRRNETARLCGQHRCRLVGNQIYYAEGSGDAWCLINAPEGVDPQPLFDDLKAIESIGLVDADEKDAGKRPPPSKH